jgi:hypothetical protein
VVGYDSNNNPLSYMVAFDQTGAVRWMTPGNYQPQIATADGGLIATDPSGAAIAFDQNGSATGVVQGSPTQSWTGSMYELGSTKQIFLAPATFAFSFAAALGGNPSGTPTYVRTQNAPQLALYALSKTDLAATPQCNALMAQFAKMANIPEATLIAQLQQAANGARDFVFDGPSSDVPLDPVKFPKSGSPGVTTVGEWFAAHATYPVYADGFSQFDGYAVWFRLDDWYSWLKGYFSKFLIFSSGKINYYGMGTAMHEILHKQAVGGGFTHDVPPGPLDMGTAVNAVGWPPGINPDNNMLSEAFGRMCFGTLQ